MTGTLRGRSHPVTRHVSLWIRCRRIVCEFYRCPIPSPRPTTSTDTHYPNADPCFQIGQDAHTRAGADAHGPHRLRDGCRV